MNDPSQPYRYDDPDPGPPPLPLKPRKHPRDPNANPWNALAYGIALVAVLVVLYVVARIAFA